MTRREEVLAKAKELGIDHDKRIKTSQLVGKIETVLGKAMEYETADPEKQPSNMTTTTNLNGAEGKAILTDNTKELEAADVPKGAETVRCIIHSGDRDNDLLEVVGCVNGEQYQALLGVEVDFPIKFLPSLQGAVTKKHIHVFDEHGNPTKERRVKWEKRFVLERL